MPLIVLALGILLLLALIIKFKLNTYVALIITSVAVALGLGMPAGQIATSIQNGIGGQLGELALVFGFGAMLGRLVADAGGAYRIAHTLIDKFGRKHLQLAVVIASFIIGIALFFEVGIVLLVPIVFAIAMEAGVPILYLGLPMAAALSVTHGFLPPHPAPTAIATALNAQTGHVLLYGIIVAIPTVYVAGILFEKVAAKMVPGAFAHRGNLSALGEQKQFKLEDTPGFDLTVSGTFDGDCHRLPDGGQQRGDAKEPNRARQCDCLHRFAKYFHADFPAVCHVGHGLQPPHSNGADHEDPRGSGEVHRDAAFGYRWRRRLQAGAD